MNRNTVVVTLVAVVALSGCSKEPEHTVGDSVELCKQAAEVPERGEWQDTEDWGSESTVDGFKVTGKYATPVEVHELTCYTITDDDPRVAHMGWDGREQDSPAVVNQQRVFSQVV